MLTGKKQLVKLDEGIKNKLLGLIGLRSNYTELEDLVDKIAAKKAKVSDIQRFAYKFENSKEVSAIKKGLPRDFDENDIIPALKQALKKKLGAKVNNPRYSSAIRKIAIAICGEITNQREYIKRLNAEINAEIAKDKEAEKKKREAEYWQKHGTGYADINKHRGNDSFYEPANGGHYTGKSRYYN